jgi:hypothetical protein
MSSFKFIAIGLFAVGALSASATGAQEARRSEAAPAGVRDPGDPEAAVPAVTYSSAFWRYRPNADVEVGAWRDVNDNVGRIGGWRVYGREVSPDTPAPTRPTGEGKAEGRSPAPPSANGHRH